MPDRVVARARALIGVPFRLHGRDPGSGLDCAGFAALCYGGAGPLPTGYGLRGCPVGEAAGHLRVSGFVPRTGAVHPGDLMLLAPGLRQLHFAVWTGAGIVHADLGLGRVVETPGWPRWPLLSIWQPGKEEG